MELSFMLSIIFTFLAIILVKTLFSNNDDTASSSAASKADNSGEESSLTQSLREEVKAGFVKSGPSVNLTEKQGLVAGLTSTDKPEEDSECRFVGKITDPVAADRRTVGEEGLHAAEVMIHAAAHEEKVKSDMTEGVTESPEDSNDMEEVDAERAPMKYAPRMLRTSQMEKMMTKEELEEEQRVEFTTDFTSL